jgi:phosphoglycolate phosphatase
VYRRHHAVALRKDTRLLPQVKGTLVYLLKKRYALAIASNRPTRFSRIIIRHLALDKYIGYVLCADKLRYRKPHPEILHRIMRKYAVSVCQALYVGDMAIDAQAGRRAKVKTVIVTTGSSTTQEIKKETPWKVVKSISGLTKFL